MPWCALWLFALLLAPAVAEPRLRVGGVVGYGWNPWFYQPFFYHPYYATGFARGPQMGEIQLRAPVKSAEVYLDGAYAGTVGDLKSIWLEPGAYNLEVRDGRHTFERRVYVLSGKAVRIDAAIGVRP